MKPPESIIETCLYVSDLAEAKQFYQEVVGLAMHAELKDRHVFFRCGKAMLLLFDASRTDDAEASLPRHGTRSNTHVAFAVDEQDIPKWRKHLSTMGVQIEREHTWPTGGLSLYFRDPSGNSLEVTTPKTWDL